MKILIFILIIGIIYINAAAKFGGDDACTTSSTCGDGQGDCDSDADCKGSLKCGIDNCDKSISSFDARDDCCYDLTKLGGDDACTTSSTSGVGQGDCDSDAQCTGSLKCGNDNCDRSISSFDAKDDCCYDLAKLGGDDACTTSSTCGVGQGDCDSDAQCTGSFKCGIDNCDRSISSFDPRDDCCYDPAKLGGDDACTTSSTCGVGQGDCDSDAQCTGSLKCGTDNCDKSISSFDAKDDCCYDLAKLGDYNACNTSSTCGVGQGDCDTDADCTGSLKCGTSNCDRSISSFDPLDDCCYALPCTDKATSCAAWKQMDFCSKGRGHYKFMSDNCQKTCNICP